MINYILSLETVCTYFCVFNCSFNLAATVGPIFEIAASFEFDTFASFLVSVRPASYNARARTLPIPSRATIGINSSLTPYFIRDRRLYISASKSSRLSNFATSYNEYVSHPPFSTILCISLGSIPTLLLIILSLVSSIHSFRANRLLEQSYFVIG